MKNICILLILLLNFNLVNAVNSVGNIENETNDTLWDLSEEFYINSKNWHKIAELNNIEDPKKIPVNFKIKFPGSKKEKLTKNTKPVKNAPKIYIKDLEGNVSVKQNNKTDWFAAEIGMELSQNSLIRTKTNSIVKIYLDYDKTTFILKENSEFQINSYSIENLEQKNKTADFSLNLGGMKFKVDKLNSRVSTFKIRTPSSVCGIRGTQGYIFSEGENNPSKYVLTEGKIYVTDKHEKYGKILNQGLSLLKK